MKNFPNEMFVSVTEGGKLSGTKLGCLWPIEKSLSHIESIQERTKSDFV